MLGSRSWRALMRRNFIFRRRQLILTFLEFALPIAFMAILVAIKNAVQGTSSFAPVEVPAFYPGNGNAFIPLSFSDYLIAIQTDRKCYFDAVTGGQVQITGIPYKSENWQVPFVKCDPTYCKDFNVNAAVEYCEYAILALAPANSSDTGGLQRAKAFESYILNRYPILNTTLNSNNSTLPFSFPMVQVFESSQAIENYVQGSQYGNTGYPKVAMGVVFNGGAPNNYAYALRQNSTNFYPGQDAQPAAKTTPNTAQLFSSYARTDNVCTGSGAPNLGNNTDSCTWQYLYNGALVIQRLVNDFILYDSGALQKGVYVAEHGVTMVTFPSPQYVKDGFYAQIAPFSPLLVTLGLLWTFTAMVWYIVLEKESRQKELMKMMSVTESDIQWSWWFSFASFHFVTATITALVTTAFYSNSQGFFLWIFWIFTFLAIISFAMTLSTLTSKSVRGILIGLLIFFVGYFLTLAVLYDTGSLSLLRLVSLHPVAAFSYGLQVIGFWEDKSTGITSSTWDTTDNPSGYTFQTCLGSLIFDSILWGVVSWYLNRVLPSDFGQPLPWYFPFTLRYWCPHSVKAPHLDDDQSNSNVVEDESIPLEPVTDTLLAQSREGTNIEIRGLTKRFGNKIAVDGLNLSIYNGQITGLLGHNGAGKTTTINMLTGMFAPTSGSAKISGKDVRTQMPLIRQEIGVCLQHDCLFPQLTVREHIQFFARIKGLYSRMSHTEAEEKVTAALQDVALSEKSNSLSKSLSGGMKRKLSVAIAFCGDSKTVLLDEPTSGMDPFSRRFTWNVIRQYRPGRTIILTTHFMDEADLLSDRIAIMAEGTLRCVGSSLFLKKTYGVGYQLTIEKAQTTRPAASLVEASVVESKVVQDEETVAAVPLEEIAGNTNLEDKLRDIVVGAVNEAHLLTNVGTEMSFQLPLGSSASFKPMFDALDEEIEKRTVSTYGVSITTLEEVFLLVARGADPTSTRKCMASSIRLAASPKPLEGAAVGKSTDDENDKMPVEATVADDRSARSKMNLETDRMFSRHLKALIRKRAIYFKRDKKAWVCTTVLPSIFVLLGFIVFKYVSPDPNYPSLTLDLNSYNVDVNIGPRNPIPYNPSGTVYTCQPGDCSYQEMDPFNPPVFCGAPAQLTGLPSCSISESTSFVKGLNVDGATPIPSNVSNIESSSTSLTGSSQLFAATQYASVFFTHDNTSVTSSGQNFSQAVVQQCKANPVPYLPPSECNLYGGIGYVVGYNFTALHVTPLYQSLVDSALAKDALNNDAFSISTTINPLPITSVESNLTGAQNAFTAWFLVVLSFPFIAGAFATFVVMERESKAKHLQTVAGVNPLAYWLSTYFWDVINYQFPLWITIILMFAFNVTAMTTQTNGVVGGIISILILYGPASAGFSYCVSFLFKSPSICNLFIIIFCFLIGMGGPLAQFIVRLLGNNPTDKQQNLVNAANIIEWILRFIPSFCLGNGILNAIYIQTYQWWAGEHITVWNHNVLLYEVIFLGWESIVYLLLAVQLDRWSNNPRAVSVWRSFADFITCRCSPKNLSLEGTDLGIADDDDVVQEQERVLAGGANDDLIVISQLSKVYDTGKVAVNNISLGIPPGQCFGLLGINGAGKTTTMAMLTAEFPPTSGDATLAGFSVRNEPEKTRRRIGYCPQFDAHFMNLTGREHVELYAAVKGVPAEYVREAAAAKLDEVGLSEEDRDRMSAGYSGGMKRRLSLACATIGQPQIVFLDECSTGVDPVARREIWQMISDMVTGGNMPDNERTSVILTTHSMEECEALCPRIAIMANGKLRCLGSAQHLKSKFGKGFQVELKVRTVSREDEDYRSILARLYRAVRQSGDEEASDINSEEVFFQMAEVVTGLCEVAGDDYLANMVTAEDPHGYIIFKNANSPIGVNLDELASFATSEIRVRNLMNFVSETYANSILRERQDNKVRYEVGATYRISRIFSDVEENKERLLLADYGISQTSLEQVFNMHAAEAEKLKHSEAH